MRVSSLRLATSALLTSVLTATAPTLAQSVKTQTKTISFLKTQVYPIDGTYLVLQDANVRIRPAIKGQRVGRRSRGERVRVVGRAKGPWLAIRSDDGKDIGFIYRSTLMPVIDGALETTIEGRLPVSTARQCHYELRFEGKTPAEGQAFEFADYGIKWACNISGQQITFYTPMFLTEGPYRGTSKRDHQITIDIIDLSDNLEDVLSTHTLWDRDKAVVRFDSITVKKFAGKPKVLKTDAGTLSEALQAAVHIAASTWNDALWTAIAHRQAKLPN